MLGPTVVVFAVGVPFLVIGGVALAVIALKDRRR
jgi:hypothetical protein